MLQKYNHVNVYFWFIFQTLNDYKVELVNDPIVRAHLDSLYDNLLEQNLCRIIEPFSRVQVEHVAQLIKLPLVCFRQITSFKLWRSYVIAEIYNALLHTLCPMYQTKCITVFMLQDTVEKKLSQMILDKKFSGK